MKIILNEDVRHLGEEGDVKNVANGYARNFLLPRGLAMPYSDETIAYFESRRAEIEARKAEKREKSRSIKERLEELNIVVSVPAGPSGKLYASVSSQTIADELLKLGFEDIERKRIDVPGNSLKSAGKYEVLVRLYEKEVANISVTVEAQISEAEKATKTKKNRSKKEDSTEPIQDTEKPENVGTETQNVESENNKTEIK